MIVPPARQHRSEIRAAARWDGMSGAEYSWNGGDCPSRDGRNPAPASANINRVTLGRRRREPIGAELLAQRGLLDLAGGGVRDLGHELHVVRHPPFGDLALQVVEDLL